MKTLNRIKKASTFIVAMLFTLTSFSKEHVTMILKNISTTSNTIEYDLYIVNDGTTSLKLSACSYGINFDASILNGGKVSYSYLSNSRDKAFQSLTAYSTATGKVKESHHVQMTTTSAKLTDAPTLIPNMQYKVGRFRMTNSVEWTPNSKAHLQLLEVTTPGYTTTLLVAFVGIEQKITALTPSKKTVTTQVEESPVLNPSKSMTIRSNKNSSKNNTELIKVYPNPAIEELGIELVANTESDMTIKIMDFQGRLLKQIQTHAILGLNKISINVSELAKGIYSIKITDTKSINYTQTFSKQ